jgi:hypothetical protein
MGGGGLAVGWGRGGGRVPMEEENVLSIEEAGMVEEGRGWAMEGRRVWTSIGRVRVGEDEGRRDVCVGGKSMRKIIRATYL